MQGNHLMQRMSCGHVMNCPVAECGFMLLLSTSADSKDLKRQTAKDWGLLQTNWRHSGWPRGLHHADCTEWRKEFTWICVTSGNLHRMRMRRGTSWLQKVGLKQLKWGCCFNNFHSCHISILLVSGKLRLRHEEVGPCTYLMSRPRKTFQCGVSSKNTASSQASWDLSVEVGESRISWQGYTASLFACFKAWSFLQLWNLQTYCTYQIKAHAAHADSGSKWVKHNCSRLSKVQCVAHMSRVVLSQAGARTAAVTQAQSSHIHWIIDWILIESVFDVYISIICRISSTTQQVFFGSSWSVYLYRFDSLKAFQALHRLTNWQEQNAFPLLLSLQGLLDSMFVFLKYFET